MWVGKLWNEKNTLIALPTKAEWCLYIFRKIFSWGLIEPKNTNGFQKHGGGKSEYWAEKYSSLSLSDGREIVQLRVKEMRQLIGVGD